MTSPLFDERPIAVIWDFDNTVIPGSMQERLFRRFGVKGTDFWEEADGLPRFYKRRGLELASGDTLYLNHILSYVREGVFKGLSNALLRELGAEIEFFPGLPEFLKSTRQIGEEPLYKELDICIEHYVVSTGLRQMIRGSKIADDIDFVWACEFVEELAPPGYLPDEGEPEKLEDPQIRDIAYTINDTTKTRAIFEINKGVNKAAQIELNARIAPEDRRVPFENMIYIADGPSDVPVFSILQQYGGQTYAVYEPGNEDDFNQVHNLLEDGRVDSVGEADYRDGKPAALWIARAIRKAAEGIVSSHKAQRESEFRARVGSAPKHLGAKSSSEHDAGL
jgi:hypothetical protein